MKLKLVDIQNFRSIGNIKLDLNNQGLVLIQGVNLDKDDGSSNGAAKSSLYYAIIYAIYGKTPDGVSGDDIVNNKIGKNTHCILEFENNGNSYRIERYRKDSHNKNKVILFRNGEEITKSSNKLTDSAIVSIIGMNITTMLNSLVFGEASVNKFSEATDKERKEILEDITNIRIYKDAQELVKEDLSVIATKVTDLENSIKNYEIRLQDIKGVQESYNQDLKSFSDRLSYYDTRIATAKKEHESVVNLDSFKAKDTLETLKDKLSKVIVKIDSIKLKDTQELQRKLSVLESKITSLNTINNEIANDLKGLAKDYKSIADSDSPVCLYCGNPLDDTHKKKELDRITKEGKDKKAVYFNNKNTLDKFSQAKSPLNKALSEYTGYNNSIKSTLDSLIAEKDGINKEISDIEYAIKKEDSLNDSLKGLIADKESFVATGKPSKPNVPDSSDIENKIKELSGELDSNKQQTDKLTKLKGVFSDRGVKSHVLDLVTPYLTNRVNYYLSILTNGTITATISTQSESKSGNISDKMSIDIDTVDGGSNYNELSTGEKKRVNIAVSLSLQDYVLSKNPEINLNVFDEIFDGLDEDGIMQVMKLLTERNKTIGTIYVISHNQALKDMFNDTIVINKKDGVSYVK